LRSTLLTLAIYVVVAVVLAAVIAHIWSSRWMVLAIPIASFVGLLARWWYERSHPSPPQ
jgi:carbon starvation protein CstA